MPIWKCVIQWGLLRNGRSPAFMNRICCGVSADRSWPRVSGISNRCSSKFEQNPSPCWRHCRQSCCPTSSLPHSDTFTWIKFAPHTCPLAHLPLLAVQEVSVLYCSSPTGLAHPLSPFSRFSYPKDEGSMLFKDVRTDVRRVMQTHQKKMTGSIYDCTVNDVITSYMHTITISSHQRYSWMMKGAPKLCNV